MKEQRRLTDLAVARDYGTFRGIHDNDNVYVTNSIDPEFKSDEDRFRELVLNYRAQGMSDEEIQSRVGGEW